MISTAMVGGGKNIVGKLSYISDIDDGTRI